MIFPWYCVAWPRNSSFLLWESSRNCLGCRVSLVQWCSASWPCRPNEWLEAYPWAYWGLGSNSAPTHPLRTGIPGGWHSPSCWDWVPGAWHHLLLPPPRAGIGARDHLSPQPWTLVLGTGSSIQGLGLSVDLEIWEQESGTPAPLHHQISRLMGSCVGQMTQHRLLEVEHLWFS